MCLYQTPGRRPPPITGRFVNTVTRGWVGARIVQTRADFMAQSLVLSIDACQGLGNSPLRTNIWLSFSQADLGPTSAQELFFSGFLKSLKLFFRRFALIASGTEIFRRVSLKFELFMETSRSHCHRYKRPWMLLSLTTAETIPHYFHVENSCPQQRRWAQL